MENVVCTLRPSSVSSANGCPIWSFSHAVYQSFILFICHGQRVSISLGTLRLLTWNWRMLVLKVETVDIFHAAPFLSKQNQWFTRSCLCNDKSLRQVLSMRLRSHKKEGFYREVIGKLKKVSTRPPDGLPATFQRRCWVWAWERPSLPRIPLLDDPRELRSFCFPQESTCRERRLRGRPPELAPTDRPTTQKGRRTTPTSARVLNLVSEKTTMIASHSNSREGWVSQYVPFVLSHFTGSWAGFEHVFWCDYASSL